jgi:DNA invertase Pin-like site-specific DNA recombinase
MTQNISQSVVAYYRVSTSDQHIENQRDAIKAAGFDIIKEFSDEISGTGASKERKGFSSLLSWIREGDTLCVFSLDRLGRDTVDVLNTVNMLEQRGVRLIILKQNFDTATPAGKLALTMFAAFAEFEHGLRKERQQEGIKRARAEGKYQGRKSKLSDEQKQVLKARYDAGECRAELARELGIDRATVHRICNKKAA